MRPQKQINTRYGNMIIFSDDPTISRSLELYGEYCYPEIELILEFVNSTSMFLDIGANIGTHTVAIAPHVKNVVAFEADVENCDLLRMNCGLQDKKVARKISVNHLALSNRVGETSTVFDYGKTHLSNQGGTDIVMTMLDNIKGFPSVDFIKIDVEGMEYNVLQGAKNTIAYYRPHMLIEMQDSNMNPFVFDLLASMSYNMYWAPCATYNPQNHKHNSENVFGKQHGVLNWLCTPQPIDTKLTPVTDRTDNIEKAVNR